MRHEISAAGADSAGEYRQLSAETEVGTAISQKSENGTELKKPGGCEVS